VWFGRKNVWCFGFRKLEYLGKKGKLGKQFESLISGTKSKKSNNQSHATRREL
jgi:hypothetical protein